MSSPEVFIGEFRKSVVDLLEAALKVKLMAERAGDAAWDHDTWVGLVTGSDITPEKFEAALVTINALTGSMTAARAVLNEMRP